MQNDIKAQAQKLRDQGYSVREVAEKIGKHYSWVSRNTTATDATPRNTRATKSVATSKRDAAVAQTLAKATSQQGCNTSEFNAIIKSVFGTVWCDEEGRYVVNCDSEARKSIKRSVKTAAERQGRTALFFEDFLSRETPVASNKLMLTLAQDLHERMELLVAEYHAAYPEASAFAIQQALIGLAVPGYRPESVETFAERNATAAQALQLVAASVISEQVVDTLTVDVLADLADIDAGLFGSATTTDANDDAGLSLDDLDDDEALINYDAVDTDWMDQDEHFYPDLDRQTAIRRVWSGSKAAQFGKRIEVKRPHDWALQQQLEDAAFMAAAALDGNQPESLLL